MKNYNLLVLFLGVIALFFIGVILLQLQVVLMPFAFAMLLSIIFKPLVLFLKRHRFPTVISLVGVLLALSLVVFLLGWALYATTGTFVRELPKYQSRIATHIDSIDAVVTALLARFNIEMAGVSWTDAFSMNSVTAALTSGVGSFISFGSTMFLVLLFMMFILAGSGDLADKIRAAFPPEHADRVARMVDVVDSQVRRYLVAKTLVSLATGLITFSILAVFGVDFPLLWGFVAFLLNYIPNIGSIFAVLLPSLLAMLQFESAGIPLLVMGLLLGCQLVMGNVVEPRIMGFSLNLSPLFILVSLIVWGWLWGLWGMVLAVPLTATIKIIFENLEPLRPISVLMSGWKPSS